ncbi:MAG: TetR/AcrR family transcriptional regulator [Anaerovoracaceae bacterium]
MNKTIISHESILNASKEVVLALGLPGLNIRDIAKRCNVSIGSIYNHFPTKSDLIIETIESLWKDIMHSFDSHKDNLNFIDNVHSLYHSILNGFGESPSFFMAHTMIVATLDKEKGRESMNKCLSQIKQKLLETLNADDEIKKDTFTSTFTMEDFIEFVFSNLITLLMKQSKSCDYLIEIIRRVIYKE